MFEAASLALIVNVDVVLEPTAFGVHEITPPELIEESDIPAGNEPLSKV